MNVLVYGSDIVDSRIKRLLNSSDVKIITMTEKITRPKDLKLFRKLTNIDLAIVDTEEIGAEKACRYLGRVRKISLALLVNEENTDWEELINYPVAAYIRKDSDDSVFASGINKVISRTSELDDIYRTEKEFTYKTLRLVMEQQ